MEHPHKMTLKAIEIMHVRELRKTQKKIQQ